MAFAASIRCIGPNLNPIHHSALCARTLCTTLLRAATKSASSHRTFIHRTSCTMKDSTVTDQVTAAPIVPSKRESDTPAAQSDAKKPAIDSAEGLRVVLLNDSAKVPTRGSTHAAGYDLSASEAVSIAPGGRGIVKTGLKVAIPTTCYGRVAPRSGLAVKKGIDVGAGVIDADYRGELGVILFNFGTEPFDVAVGDRVAQLILERIATPPVIQVESLDDTVRGEAGFGSTGVAEKTAA